MRVPIKLVYILLCTALVLGVNACGYRDTPVAYHVCDEFHEDCSVSARFEDMDSCKRYEERSAMLCDSVSQPGVLICRAAEPDRPVIATSYCSQ